MTKVNLRQKLLSNLHTHGKTLWEVCVLLSLSVSESYKKNLSDAALPNLMSERCGEGIFNASNRHFHQSIPFYTDAALRPV